jgi:hypothetical protein
MRFAAFSRIAACIVGISCSFAPMTSPAQSCKCPKNPGPGGGVQCAKDQIATCDPSSGECNCTCDSVQAGKTKADYQAQIFSKVLHTKVDPDELSSPQYGKFVSSFRKSNGDKGTFSFDKEAGAGRGRQVTVGVPEWLEEVLGGKGGVSIGPGASLQNCPNGICIGGENSGTATVNNFAPPERRLSDEQMLSLVACLKTNPGKFTVAAISNNGEAYRYAQDWSQVFRAAGWKNEQPIPVAIIMIAGGMWSGLRITIPGTWDDISQRASIADGSPEKNALECIKRAHIGGAAIADKDKPTGSVRLEVSDQPEKK